MAGQWPLEPRILVRIQEGQLRSSRLPVCRSTARVLAGWMTGRRPARLSSIPTLSYKALHGRACRTRTRIQTVVGPGQPAISGRDLATVGGAALPAHM